MSETPSAPANTGATTPAPETTAGTTAVPDNGTTGNPADATPTQSNPTDSSSVSDDEGVQSLAAKETDDVDHEGTGPGDDVDNLPESNTDENPEGPDVA